MEQTLAPRFTAAIIPNSPELGHSERPSTGNGQAGYPHSGTPTQQYQGMSQGYTLVVQWLGLHHMGLWVRSLVGELRSCKLRRRQEQRLQTKKKGMSQ